MSIAILTFQLKHPTVEEPIYVGFLLAVAKQAKQLSCDAFLSSC